MVVSEEEEEAGWIWRTPGAFRESRGTFLVLGFGVLMQIVLWAVVARQFLGAGR